MSSKLANGPKISGQIVGLPRAVKRLIALGMDAGICVASVLLAFYLRLGVWVPIKGPPYSPILASIAIALPIFVSFGLYRAIFRYAGWNAILEIARAVLLYSIPFAYIYTYLSIDGVPRTIGLIQPILLFLMIAASRIFARAYLGETYQRMWRAASVPRVVIYGAGSAGRGLANAIQQGSEMRLVGFVDDDPGLWRQTINGTPVIKPPNLHTFVSRKQVSDILLAIPSASRARRAEIVSDLRALDVHVRTLPGLLDMARGTVSINDLRELQIQDLLGRAPVPPNEALLSRNIADKTVLVTGAGGSIGSELCRQILAIGPERLLMVEVSEFNLYTIHQELVQEARRQDFDEESLLPILGSVTDERRMAEVLETWRPQTIFHAAAYKHVPLVEQNPVEGLRNNVKGTLTLAKLAQSHGCRDFTLISTDKAVRPTNLMGASKRISELVLQALQNQAGATTFSAVRFGNVLGSSGSVVPLFRSQVAAGGPITITHEDITRYFMTIPEAAQLVLQAGAMAQGGDVFLLDMGEPVKIVDLARNIVELSGLTVRDEQRPDGDIEIKVVGLRPGEKLYEELLIGDDPKPSEHPRIMRSCEAGIPWRILENLLGELDEAIATGDAAWLRIICGRIVPEYSPNSPLADLVASASERRSVFPFRPAPELVSARRSGVPLAPDAGVGDRLG